MACWLAYLRFGPGSLSALVGEGVSDPFPADSNRTSLWLNSNRLSGTIPSELGVLSGLAALIPVQSA